MHRSLLLIVLLFSGTWVMAQQNTVQKTASTLQEQAVEVVPSANTSGIRSNTAATIREQATPPPTPLPPQPGEIRQTTAPVILLEKSDEDK